MSLTVKELINFNKILWSYSLLTLSPWGPTIPGGPGTPRSPYRNSWFMALESLKNYSININSNKVDAKRIIFLLKKYYNSSVSTISHQLSAFSIMMVDCSWYPILSVSHFGCALSQTACYSSFFWYYSTLIIFSCSTAFDRVL